MRPIRHMPLWMQADFERQERLAWKPTPEAFEAFKVRDLELARKNVIGREADEVLHNLLTYGQAKS